MTLRSLTDRTHPAGLRRHLLLSALVLLLLGTPVFGVAAEDADFGKLAGCAACRDLEALGLVESLADKATAQTAPAPQPEWKYVPVRRFVLELEDALSRSTAWAVSEPNDEVLWARLRLEVEAQLLDLVVRGATASAKPDQAYFVRCDRTTMTQADLEAERTVIEVGIALDRPGEFASFRIVLE